MNQRDTDPRVFFAAERTLLAWLRTALALVALGFVVSRFGLFVRLLTGQARGAHPPDRYALSAVLGIAFVVTGTLAVILAAVQHQRFVAALPEADLPRSYSKILAVVLSLFVGALGVALAAYLLVTEQ